MFATIHELVLTMWAGLMLQLTFSGEAPTSHPMYSIYFIVREELH